MAEVNVLFVDFDGIIGDNNERADRANNLVDQLVGPLKPYIDEKKYKELRQDVFYHKDIFYEADSILEDEEIEGVKEKINRFAYKGWTIVVLTSLPEYRRDERITWLCKHGFPFFAIECKDTDSYQFVKTVRWKRSTVRSLSRALRATRVMVVDNEQKVIDEVLMDRDDKDRTYILEGYTSFDQIQGMI